MNGKVRKSREQLLDELSSAVRAQQRSVDLFDQAVVDRFGLNRTDGRVVDLLQEFGPMSAGELARAAHLSTGAVTTAIDRLVERDLVRRMDDPLDRRRVIVGITKKTVGICAEIFMPLHAEGNVLLERFSEAELTAIIEFLRLDRDLNERHRLALIERPSVHQPKAR